MQKRKPKDILKTREITSEIFLVRHGETEANRKKLLFGHLDWDLNKTGTRQIQNCSKRLKQIIKDRKVSCIITSNLLRAKHSAKIISKVIGIKNIIIVKDISEKSEGLWEGKDFWQVKKEDPVNYKTWLKNPFKNKPPKGESVLDLDKRVKKFYKTILKKHLGKNIIVVSHSGPIKMFLLNLLQANINKFWYLKIECGSITEVHLSKKHSMIWGVNVK